MKKYFLFTLIVLLCMNVNAQYKKVSFLNKKGRTYDFGGTAHFLTDGNAIVPGFIYSFGRQRAERKTFHWFDLEILFPAKFSYKTEDFTTKVPVTVNGKSQPGLIFRYNLAYYLTDNSNSANKLLPFVTGGLHITLIGGSTDGYLTYTPDTYYDVQKKPADRDLNLGANLGLGVIYNITSKFGLKMTGGYSYQYNSNSKYSESYKPGYSTYDFFSSHPYATLGVRFTMSREKK
jgi:hypothetical protein